MVIFQMAGGLDNGCQTMKTCGHFFPTFFVFFPKFFRGLVIGIYAPPGIDVQLKCLKVLRSQANSHKNRSFSSCLTIVTPFYFFTFFSGMNKTKSLPPSSWCSDSGRPDTNMIPKNKNSSRSERPGSLGRP